MAPKKGDRIELSNKPNEYFLVEKVTPGTDGRGQQFWIAVVIDKNQNKLTLHSDNVSSWKHFQNPNYPWHDEMIRDREDQELRRTQEGLVAGFEARHKFDDGRPLKRNMILSVLDGAIGDLGVFSGERVYVKEIDYQTETVKVVPANEELADLGGLTVPAADLITHSRPVLSQRVAVEPVRLPGGETVNMETFISMTPEFNKMVQAGQVTARVQVFKNYRSSSGDERNEGYGEERYLQDMANLGFTNPVGVRTNVSKEEREGAHYIQNDAPLTFDASGGKTSLFGPWQATIRISQPISQAAMLEIIRFTGKTPEQIYAASDGAKIFHSNPLYKNMVAIGHFAPQLV
jgi:hypothetical protein